MISNIYPILAYGNESLTKESKSIEINFEIKDLINDMFATMNDSGGIGLAAPQIGKNIKLFIIDISYLKSHEKGHPFYKSVFINPEIIEEEGEEWGFKEGCLSIPSVIVNVKRKPIIKIKYFDENWKQQEVVVDRMLARVIQHEHDHLKGILHIDYATALNKKIMKKKLDEIKTGKINVNYKMKFLS
ncbi:MAG: peptide deformylase [Bacteroidetes bacterium]|nr:peptide deformylase [Bacteroidota bacterium]